MNLKIEKAVLLQNEINDALTDIKKYRKKYNITKF